MFESTACVRDRGRRFIERALRIATLWLVMLILAIAGRAAEGEHYAGEIAGYGGMQHFPGVTKALLGGQIGSIIGKQSLVFVETSYAPLGEGNNLINFGGGLHIGIPTSIEKLVPYFSVVGGLGRFSGNGESANRAMYGAGFGARYFVGDRWGVRPEFRWQRYRAAA
jgi:hypothetical protein